MSLCPYCGAYSPRSCDLEEDMGGVCPWEESGEWDRQNQIEDEEDDGA